MGHEPDRLVSTFILIYINVHYKFILMLSIYTYVRPSSRDIGYATTRNADYSHDKYPFVQYMFYSLNCIAIAICFYVMAISMIYNMWGPIMAMNGHDASAVKEAAILMKENQFQIFLLMNIVFMLILLATSFFLWSLLDSIPAAICTVLMVGGAVVVIHYGFLTVRTFDPNITLHQILFPYIAVEAEKKDIIAEQDEVDARLKVLIIALVYLSLHDCIYHVYLTYYLLWLCLHLFV